MTSKRFGLVLFRSISIAVNTEILNDVACVLLVFFTFMLRSFSCNQNVGRELVHYKKYMCYVMNQDAPSVTPLVTVA